MTMGRPSALTAEWFRHDVAHSDSLAIMQHKWRNDGYAFWFKLREALARAQGHVISIKEPARWELFLAEMHLEDDQAHEMLALLARVGEIDKDLYELDGVIWCQEFVDGLRKLYDKRINLLPEKPTLINTSRAGKSGGAEVSDAETRHSTVQDRTGETPPTPPAGGKPPTPPPDDILSKPLRASFDLFWSMWPKAKKKSKGKAERAWKKLKPDAELLAAIMGKLKQAQASVEWAKEDGKYIPHPSTWLNAKGWEDEYTPNPGGNGSGSGKPADYIKYGTGVLNDQEGVTP